MAGEWNHTTSMPHLRSHALGTWLLHALLLSVSSPAAAGEPSDVEKYCVETGPGAIASLYLLNEQLERVIQLTDPNAPSDKGWLFVRWSAPTISTPAHPTGERQPVDDQLKRIAQLCEFDSYMEEIDTAEKSVNATSITALTCKVQGRRFGPVYAIVADSSENPSKTAFGDSPGREVFLLTKLSYDDPKKYADPDRTRGFFEWLIGTDSNRGLQKLEDLRALSHRFVETRVKPSQRLIKQKLDDEKRLYRTRCKRDPDEPRLQDFDPKLRFLDPRLITDFVSPPGKVKYNLGTPIPGGKVTLSEVRASLDAGVGISEDLQLLGGTFQHGGYVVVCQTKLMEACVAACKGFPAVGECDCASMLKNVYGPRCDVEATQRRLAF